MVGKIIDIGNSKGIRIPKNLLDEVGLQGEVSLEAARGALVIRPVKTARANWAKAFKAMAQRGDDKMLDPDVGQLSSWDEEEWEW